MDAANHPFEDQTSYWNYRLFLADARADRLARGYAQPLGTWQPPMNCIGIVVADGFPEQRLALEMEKGITRFGSTVTWVIRDRPADKRDFLTALFDTYGLEPVVAKPLPYWGASRAFWRDSEMLSLCSKVMVFHDGKSGVTKRFIGKDRVRVILAS